MHNYNWWLWLNVFNISDVIFAVFLLLRNLSNTSSILIYWFSILNACEVYFIFPIWPRETYIWKYRDKFYTDLCEVEENKYSKDFQNHVKTPFQLKLTIHYSFKLWILEWDVSFGYKINSLVPATVIILS